MMVPLEAGFKGCYPFLILSSRRILPLTQHSSIPKRVTSSFQHSIGHMAADITPPGWVKAWPYVPGSLLTFKCRRSLFFSGRDRFKKICCRKRLVQSFIFIVQRMGHGFDQGLVHRSLGQVYRQSGTLRWN